MKTSKFYRIQNELEVIWLSILGAQNRIFTFDHQGNQSLEIIYSYITGQVMKHSPEGQAPFQTCPINFEDFNLLVQRAPFIEVLAYPGREKYAY